MKAFLLRIEPVVWPLFGMGIMLSTLLLPGYLLTIGLAGPLGLLPEGALSFERVHDIATNPLGRLVLLGLIALPLWRGAHQVRAVVADHWGTAADVLAGSLLYAIAAAGSVLGILAVLAL